MKLLNAPWTAEDDLQLRQLAGSGVHLRAIALKLRRTESSVKARARKIGVSVKPPPRGQFRVDELAKAMSGT